MVRMLTSRAGIFYSASDRVERQTERRMSFGLIAVLGHFASRGLVPLSWFACLLINPEGKAVKLDSPGCSDN